MTNNNVPSNSGNEGQCIELPSFRTLPPLSLQVTALKEAERRLLETKNVSPATYTDLEYCFNEAYREIKRNLGAVQFQIVKSEELYEKAKAIALMEKWPEYMKAKRVDNNQDNRKAFISLDDECSEVKNRLDSLKALEIFLEGKIKVMENVCKYMRKAMDLILRSGITPQMYSTIKK